MTNTPRRRRAHNPRASPPLPPFSLCAVTVAGVVNSETFENAATDEGCAYQTLNGALPNEHGTWLYGRDGWCDGNAVRPWVVDITTDVDFSAAAVNLTYRGLFEGKDPNPQPQVNMPYIIVHR